MHLIKLDATDSTNAYLRRLLLSTVPEDYTVVSAKQQTQGRGQMGTHWESEMDKNLTFSLLRRDLSIPADQGFILNICVSMALYAVLHRIKLPDLSIKWPNDILSGTSKIAGILIENKIQGPEISTSIIGIGLNVNQTDFGNLPNASSLKLKLAKAFNLDMLLVSIVDEVKKVFLDKEHGGESHLWDAYQNVLFKIGERMPFEDSDGKRFIGTIQGVSKDGKLVIATEDSVSKAFALKEVRLLY
ncbi:MAG TPA: biotin--[acetyl-CoA-carboxylase] ligase [Pricia antarctica]|uniref:Biotin--[acetyl-CoA-carboxylase] ligase n=2 Tax=root TaxID=1 RepID=A0A831VRQ0_9FLAO|nr:biotin--[acetyl-CoA-carboxylase] ligase [Pricia antarctica]